MVEALAPHIGVFAPAFTLAIAAGGLVDVVINVTSADALAHEPGKLVRFHALWNVACVVGATVTGIVLRLGASWRVVWVGIAVARDRRRARSPTAPRFPSRSASSIRRCSAR